MKGVVLAVALIVAVSCICVEAANPNTQKKKWIKPKMSNTRMIRAKIVPRGFFQEQQQPQSFAPKPTIFKKSGSPTCTFSGSAGLCIDHTACTGQGGTAHSGLCSGAANIQCCVMPVVVAAGTACTAQVPVSGSAGPLQPNFAKVDTRSEATIATLHPKVANIFRALVNGAAAYGYNIRLISGMRTYAQQSALYAQGRTAKGPVVTNAPAGWSNHNFGLAADIGVFDGNNYVPESPIYAKVGPIGVALGLEWGGSWTSIKDMPHYEYPPAWSKGGGESAMLAGLRARHAANKDVLDASDNVPVGTIPPVGGAGPTKATAGTCQNSSGCGAGKLFAASGCGSLQCCVSN